MFVKNYFRLGIEFWCEVFEDKNNPALWRGKKLCVLFSVWPIASSNYCATCSFPYLRAKKNYWRLVASLLFTWWSYHAFKRFPSFSYLSCTFRLSRHLFAYYSIFGKPSLGWEATITVYGLVSPLLIELLAYTKARLLSLIFSLRLLDLCKGGSLSS